MKTRYWIIISVVAGVAMWGGIFFAVKAILPPKLPEMVGPVERDSPIEPDSPIGLLLKEARAAEDAKNHQRAIELYSTGIDDDKAAGLVRRELLLGRAFAYEGAQRYEHAERDFSAALNIEPSDPEFYAKRGFFLTRRKRYDEALADFAKGTRLDPGNGVNAYGEGLLYEDRGEYKRAIERFDEALRLEPKAAIYYVARGSAHNHVRMYKKAYADYDKALLIGFSTPLSAALAREGRGFASMMLRDNRRAKDDFDHVLKVWPRDSNVLAWRGWTYKKLGEKELAITDYKAALAIDPDNKLIAEQLKQLETP